MTSWISKVPNVQKMIWCQICVFSLIIWRGSESLDEVFFFVFFCLTGSSTTEHQDTQSGNSFHMTHFTTKFQGNSGNATRAEINCNFLSIRTKNILNCNHLVLCNMLWNYVNFRHWHMIYHHFQPKGGSWKHEGGHGQKRGHGKHPGETFFSFRKHFP